MATVASFQQQQHPSREQGYAYGDTVRSMASASTVSMEPTAASGTTSWVKSKKRDWDNAFLTKYHDLETTLQENDKWLAIYWQNIAGMKDTKKPSMAITEALKTSSSKRNVRSRMDVRDVFFASAGTIGSAASSNGTLRLSPTYGALQFGSKRAKRLSSHYGSMQGNTLSMTLAEMAMIPPKSPYMTNVVSPPSAATTLASSGLAAPEETATTTTATNGLVRKKDVAGVPSLRTQRSQESAVAHKVVAMRRQPSGPLVRSNSTAAQTAAAVKLLQESTTSPVETAMDMQVEGAPEEQDVTPEPPKQQRFTALTTVPTLRDMILNRQSPMASKQRTPPLTTNIDMALGSLSLDAASRNKQKAAVQQQQQQQQTNHDETTTPSQPRTTVVQHPRTVSNASSQASAGTTRSEEDVRDRLQRIRIALSRTNTTVQVAEEPLTGGLELARKRIDRIEAALSPQTTAEDITALCNDIDEVEELLPPSSDASPMHQGKERKSAIYVDVDIDVAPIQMDGIGDADDAEHTSPGKRKHSDDEKHGDAQSAQTAAPSSRLLAPTASTIAKGRKGRAAAALQVAPKGAATTGIPRRPAGVIPKALAVPPRTDSRLPHAAAMGRVAEARRKFDAPTASAFVSPVAAMRPGHSSIGMGNSAAGGQVRRPPGTSTKPHAKPVQKSSTAAMREAARKAEAIRAHAAAASARRPVGKPKMQQQSSDPLFKTVGRSGSTQRANKAAQRARPAPLATDSSDGSGSSDDAPGGAMAIPARTNASSASSVAESADSSSGRWGVASMLAMLSPSSWKAQEATQQQQQQQETPTGGARKRDSSSPYDVASPQTPYQPRPEHASSRSQLVMPTYKDVAVPLRKSGASSYSEASAGAPRRTSRVSGVSSLFTDDEDRQPTRAKSTADLRDAVTPARRMRVSSARSDDYTSIIPVGSDSPPEIESDYSDEYSDDEFSPAPRPKKNDFRIPKWATTPELAKGLQRQELVNPDRIFGRVKPLRINDVFNRADAADQRRKPRNSSMIWSGSDALTADEELEYIRRMGYE
ncbi:hypothetical protein LPJ59_000273 [Coemansia sp. RSA 2399]|nr:hypothetical protein LPJ59_000273 [Coemansia sp. RSA 2399]KAJ1907636.1 hypothetical protein LPJ81_000625 [Coemansia sp. IMI 209127]